MVRGLAEARQYRAIHVDAVAWPSVSAASRREARCDIMVDRSHPGVLSVLAEMNVPPSGRASRFS